MKIHLTGKVAGVTISPAQSGYSESQYQYALHTVDPFIKAMGFGGMIGTREYVFTDQPGTCEGANFISDLNDYLSQNGISKTGDVADYEHAKAPLLSFKLLRMLTQRLLRKKMLLRRPKLT